VLCTVRGKTIADMYQPQKNRKKVFCIKHSMQYIVTFGIALLFWNCSDQTPTGSSGSLWELSEATHLSVREDTALSRNAVKSVYLISTWRDLEYLSANFISNPDLLTYSYELTGDIEFPDLRLVPSDEEGHYFTNGFTPIGRKNEEGVGNEFSFTGTFDGKGNTISNLVINKSGKYVGLFGCVSGKEEADPEFAEIKNVHLKNIDVRGGEFVGGLIGKVETASIHSSSVEGVVRGNRMVGGMLGELSHNEWDMEKRKAIKIKGNRVSVRVEGRYDEIGGMIGASEIGIGDHGLQVDTDNQKISIQIIENHIDSTVTGNNDVGGVVGRMKLGLFENNYATGPVKGVNRVGGLVGAGDSLRIGKSSFTKNSIEGNTDVGGLVGLLRREIGERGGIIIESYASGSVHGTERVGGLVGKIVGGSISDSYASMHVKGLKESGGLAGVLLGGSFVSRVYTNGSLTALNSRGLDLGMLYGSMEEESHIIDYFPTLNSTYTFFDGGVKKTKSIEFGKGTKIVFEDYEDPAGRLEEMFHIEEKLPEKWKKMSGSPWLLLSWQK